MLRFVALLALGACAAHAPPVANRETVTTYRITPAEIPGGEGMHSMSHSSTKVAGQLAIRGDRATLALDLETDVGYVHCNFDPRTTMQACAPPDAKDTHTHEHLELAGTATRTGDTIAFALSARDVHATLTCRDAGAKLACELDRLGVFGPRPAALELVR